MAEKPKNEVALPSSKSTTLSATPLTRLIDLPPAARIQSLEYSLEQQERLLEPASNDDISKMLSVVVAMIGCPIPPTPVLTKCIEMLSEYPLDLIERAGSDVLRVHVWNSFPRVAEFIQHIDKSHKERLESKRHTQAMLDFYQGKPDMHRIARPRSGGKGPRSLGAVLPQITRRNDE